MTTPENLPRFDKPEAARSSKASSTDLAVAPRSSAALGTSPAAGTTGRAAVRASIARAEDLNASRAALLAGRECKMSGPGAAGGTYAVEAGGHVARTWHICPACFPEA